MQDAQDIHVLLALHIKDEVGIRGELDGAEPWEVELPRVARRSERRMRGERGKERSHLVYESARDLGPRLALIMIDRDLKIEPRPLPGDDAF